jgi:hypothetical protein
MIAMQSDHVDSLIERAEKEISETKKTESMSVFNDMLPESFYDSNLYSEREKSIRKGKS